VVTHDPVDAYALADRVVVIEEGRVVQEGSLADVAAHPRSRYVAELAGINLLSGVMSSDGVFTGAGGATVVIAGDDAVAGPAFASIRPQAISLHREQPEGSQRNAWLLTVVDIDQQHDRVRVRLAGAHELVAEITPAALAAMKLRPGESVWAAAKATEVHSYVR
jgi:molybdate transport system ATP-binding protein